MIEEITYKYYVDVTTLERFKNSLYKVKDLNALKTDLKYIQDSYINQIKNARLKKYKTGKESDVRWYKETKDKRDLIGSFILAIQDEQSKQRKNKSKNIRDTFITVAKEKLSEEQLIEIWDEVNKRNDIN